VTTLQSHVQQYDGLLQEAYMALYFATKAQRKENHDIAMQNFWLTIDLYFEKIAKFSAFQCQKGCSHCCFDNPHGITGIELARILPLLRPAQKKMIVTQAAAFRALQKQHPKPQLEWKKQCHPCPLLENHQCSIYSHRPLACRSFFSLYSPDWCHPKHKNYQVNPQIDCDSLHALLVECANKYDLPRSTDLLTGLASLLEEI